MSSLEQHLFSTARISIALIGGGLLCLGVVVVFISTSTLEVRTEALQPILGDVIYAGFLTIAITVAMLIGTLWAVDRTERPPVPSPGTVPLTPQFGAAFDRIVAGERPWVWSIATAQQRQRIRARLRDAAIGTIVRTSAASRETARRQVDRGAWTTDAEAAAFLGRTSIAKSTLLSMIAVLLLGTSDSKSVTITRGTPHPIPNRELNIHPHPDRDRTQRPLRSRPGVP